MAAVFMSYLHSTKYFSDKPLKFSEMIVLFTLPNSFAVSFIEEWENLLFLNDSITRSSKFSFTLFTNSSGKSFNSIIVLFVASQNTFARLITDSNSLTFPFQLYSFSAFNAAMEI